MQKRRTRTNHARIVANDLAKLFVSLAETCMLESVFEGQQDAVAREGLLEQVESAVARGFDGVGDSAVTGYHVHWSVIVVLPEKSQEIDSVVVRQLYVEKECIGAPFCGISAKFLSRN